MYVAVECRKPFVSLRVRHLLLSINGLARLLLRDHPTSAILAEVGDD